MTVLFLHAVGLDSRAASFLDLPDVIAPTLPGHGARSRPRAGLTLDDIADEVVGWTNGPLHIVGASFGAMVALHVALRHPDRVKSMVLACTTARADATVMEERARLTEQRGAAAMVYSTLERWFSAAYLGRSPLPPALDYARNCLESADADALADTWRAMAQHDVLDRLGEIRVPTTCIAGARDVAAPPQAMPALAAGLPAARLVVLDAPHMAFLEEPRSFVDATQEHLRWWASAVREDGR